MRRLLLALLFVLILLGLGAGAVLLTRDLLAGAPAPTLAPTPWQNPLDTVQPDAVAPDLALRSLAGEPTYITAEQALQAAELATAYAAVVFSPEMASDRRAGLLLSLADHYLQAERREAARACLLQVRDIAALEPTLSDLQRAEVSMQAGVYWREVGVRDEARRSFDQAAGIAAGSRVLLPAQRRQLFTRLADEYRILGARERAEDAERRATAPPTPATEDGAVTPVLDALYGEWALSDEVTVLVSERQARARHIIEIRSQDLTADVTPEAADLGEFLRREDAARAAWFAEAGSQPDLAARASALREQISWLAVKLRTAQRGYGLVLVPEWEADVPGIRASLAAAVTAWAQAMESQLLSLPDPQTTRRGELELLRVQVLWGRLGLYADYPADALVQGLVDAVETLRLHGQLGGLLLDVSGEGAGRTFTVSENP